MCWNYVQGTKNIWTRVRLMQSLLPAFATMIKGLYLKYDPFLRWGCFSTNVQVTLNYTESTGYGFSLVMVFPWSCPWCPFKSCSTDFPNGGDLWTCWTIKMALPSHNASWNKSVKLTSPLKWVQYFISLTSFFLIQ